MSDYLKFLSTNEYADKYGIYTPAVECDCGNACDGDEPKIKVKQCEQCEDKMIEHEEGNVVDMDTDDMLVCGYCGIEEYYMKDCDCSEEVITYSEFEEKISEETMGNKDEYHRILDGGRC
jgi:hypothetical protein